MVKREGVRQALMHVLDPDVPANLVDLGLVYGIEVLGDTVAVQLGLTAPTPAAERDVAEAARQEILSRTRARHVRVEVVRQPRWTAGMMTAQARGALPVTADEG